MTPEQRDDLANALRDIGRAAWWLHELLGCETVTEVLECTAMVRVYTNSAQPELKRLGWGRR